MRRFGLTLFAVPLLFAGATIALAEQPAASGKAERRVCRTEQRTGSLIPRRRICRTEAEWRTIDANDRLAVESLQNRNNGACVPRGGSSSCE